MIRAATTRCRSKITCRKSLFLDASSVGVVRPNLPAVAVYSFTRYDPSSKIVSSARGGGGGGTSILGGRGSLAKFWARSSQVHQIKGKTWEVLIQQDAKVVKNPNFGERGW